MSPEPHATLKTPVVLDEESRDPAITVSMEAGYVVIGLSRRLDSATTVALTAAVNAAVAAGSTAVVHLGAAGVRQPISPIAPVGPIRWASPSSAAVGASDRTAKTAPDISPAGSGYIRLGAPGAWWTVDLRNRRFCRSATPVDPRFVGTDLWIGVRRLVLSASTMTVVTGDGRLISAHRARPAA